MVPQDTYRTGGQDNRIDKKNNEAALTVNSGNGS